MLRPALLFAVALLLLLCGLAGCGSESRAGQQAEAERFVRAELLDRYELDEDGRGPWTLGEVTCSHDQGRRFSCSASAYRDPSPNESEMSLAAVGVVCTGGHCNWTSHHAPAAKPWPGYLRVYGTRAGTSPSGWTPYAPIQNDSG